ncbi:tRNA pseudouridine(38-40) synthase TruA [Corynebacterium spheniscorum]|uniref:tRNA pseudouridine synthase A n=1 Tax=Corynebacterium spheniscorum TaxID=185761 RepID=A0A1I2PTV8_9CORY|nr:tRNA pseudouridine(38-40) synthase TruA [Corynebacterium spheniscorum]KAA8723811.1 tRNA pseudouridine(38-40) synthase TruA [Corynebacterium spheniscorum]SFG17046.1 tRNA pseudouridine38-40 synthase [Corynebacterium spheniscorum]
MRIRLDLAYNGSNFHGWARQQGELRTVQGVLEDNLRMILRHPELQLTVAGRTDAGVHATAQVAHFDVPDEALQQRSIDGDPNRLVRRLARLLPEDVRVHACTEVPDTFDARFSALRRHYRYRITTHPRGALPTRTIDTATWPRPVDLPLMQAAADTLLGLHDFAAFCKPREYATTIRTLERFDWHDASTEEEPQLYIAEVTADAFCWNMVRSLVGTCLAIGQGQQAPNFTAELLNLRHRSPQVRPAPARGLTLSGVDYPPPADLEKRALKTRAKRAAL